MKPLLRQIILPVCLFFVGCGIAIFLLCFPWSDEYFSLRHRIGRFLVGDAVIFTKSQKSSAQYVVPYVRVVESGQLFIVPSDIFGTPSDGTIGMSRVLASGVYKNELIPVEDWKGYSSVFVCLFKDETTQLDDRTHQPICTKAQIL